MSNYYTKTEVDSAVAGTVSQKTNSSEYPQLYQRSSKNEDGLRILQSIWQDDESVLIGYSAAQRDQYGCVQVGTPRKNVDATNKKYVDEAIATVDERFNEYATESYVDAEIQDATANKLTVEMSGGRTPVSTHNFALTIDDEYFYEEHDNIMFTFEGDVNPDFKLTINGRTTKAILFNGTRCSDLDVYWDYSMYTDWNSAYYVYFGEEMGVEIGDTIQFTIDVYDDSVLTGGMQINMAPVGEDQIKLSVAPMEDDTPSEPPVLVVSGNTAKLSLGGVLYPLNIQVVNEAGTDESAVMSQKAVTDALAALREELLAAIQTGAQQAAEEIIMTGEW